MSEGRRPALLAYLLRLGRDPAVESSDAQLLERFIGERDEAAFASLMRRHGPLVWNVCRRVLVEEHAAEDAFQATFLVLVRKARSVSKRESVRSWLYGVALRVALRARQREGLRRVREQSTPPRQADTAAEADWDDMRSILDEEIQRLPEKYRLPIILCYLEGQTNDEAARQLNCPRGTIATRLARAREQLRSRLVRRGLTLSTGALTALLADNAMSAALSPLLFAQTTKGVLAGTVSVSITTLTEGALHTMFVTKMKTALSAVLALIVVGGAGVSTYYLRAQAPAPKQEDVRQSAVKALADLGLDKPPTLMEKLLDKRREMAAQEMRIRYEKYRAGAQDATLDLALAGSKRLRKAELELSKNQADRLAAHEKHLKLMKEIVKICQAKYTVGRISLADYSQAEYERMDAEIELEREKARK